MIIYFGALHFCCFLLINSYLFFWQERRLAVFSVIFQIIWGSLLFFSSNSMDFFWILNFSSFIVFFCFLFCFFLFFSRFIIFDFIFEFLLILFYFLFFAFLNFYYLFLDFDLLSSISGLFFFACFRIAYLAYHFTFSSFLDLYLSYFLSWWTSFWVRIFFHFFFSFSLFAFFGGAGFLILDILSQTFFNLILFFFGLIFFPYFIFVADYFVDKLFSKTFSSSASYSYSSRAQTFKSSILWIARFVFGLMYFFFWLSFLSINISTFSWNLSLIIAFGSFGFKGIIDDFVNGIFVLIEDSINIGEFIEIDSNSGVVEDVSLRVIKLRHFDGSLFIIPFRRVDIIKNRSKEFVFILFQISVDAALPSSFVLDWINLSFKLFKSSKEFAKYSPYILGDIEIIGVTSISSYGAVYEARLKIIPLNVRFIKGAFFMFLSDLAAERSIKFGLDFSLVTS